MKRTISLILSAVLLALPSCQEDLPLEGTGITEATWSEDVQVDEDGKKLSYTFTAAGSWTAETSQPEWCSILTPEGVSGAAALRVSVAKNTATEDRSAEVTIRVKGYPEAVTITISQNAGVIEQGDGRYREINEWIYEKMASTYLWNEPIPTIALDYSIGYQDFLASILNGVAKCGDVNHDDGAYDGDYRTEFYTQVISNAPETRSIGQATRGNGFYLLRPVNLGTAVGILVDTVVPDGPADRNGIMRGHFITEVNGVQITTSNYKNVLNKIYTDQLSVLINTVEWQGADLDIAVITPVKTVELYPEEYIDPSIYKYTVVPLANGKKVGYLMYMGFYSTFDQQLIAVFDYFRNEGIDDLVLDLRYNNGGEILSSTVMATLIAGEQHKGQTLARLAFNSARTAAGETAEYKIGKIETLEYPDGYLPIEEALSHSVDLDRVFVIATEHTASASEIIINGLRGIGIEVNLIGRTTSGKNVGMEGFDKRYMNYDFILYPVSFYIENAQGFRDYADGFEPDFYLDDSSFYPGGDFGTVGDYLCNVAFGWINSGTRPSRTMVPCKMATTGTALDFAPARSMGGSQVIYR